MDKDLRSFLIGGIITLGIVGGSYGGCVAGCSSCNNLTYSDGSRVGVINKVSKKGLIWKTYEGQMALEGIINTGESIGANVWDFSIDEESRHGENKEELAQKLNDYMEQGVKVKVKYIQQGATWPWRSSTTYLVQNVELLQKK